MLEFNIRNQEISRIDNFSPAEKSVGYLVAKFNFKTEDWNGATKRAIFRNVKSKVEKDTKLEDDSCIVPWEVLVGSSVIEVSVHGVIDTENITTDVAVFNLDRTLQGGSATQEPSQTVYEQMLKEMQETKDIAQSVRDDADAGKFNGGGSIDQEALLQLAIKTTTSPSPFHHITDGANMKVLDFGMEGKTEQKTTSGKNLCDLQIGKQFNIYNGEIEEAVHYAMCTIEASEEMSVTISVPSTEEHGWYLSYMRYNGVTTNIYERILPGNSVSITLSEGVTMLSGDAIDSKGASLTEFKPIKVQIELGSTATTYEPYTNGPSPNPDYTQEIELAGVYNEETGRYEIGCKVVKANLLNYKEVVNNFRNKNYVKLSSGYNVTSLQFEPNTEYYMKVNGIRCTWATFLISTQQNVNGSVAKAVGVSNTWNSENCVTTDETGLIYFGISNPIDNHIDQIEQSLREALVQIEVGASATEYEEYVSQPFSLTSPVPLTKWDYLVKVDGKWYWDYKSRLYEVTGKENFQVGDSVYTTGSSTNQYFDVTDKVKDAPYRQNGFCTGLSFCGGVWQKDDGTIGFTYNNEQIHMRLPNVLLGVSDDATSTEKRVAYVTYLQEKYANGDSIKLLYETKEHELVPLPDEEQTLLNNLEMYYGVTNLYNDQGCPMWLTYVADTKLYVDKKLLEIQQAMI